MVYFRCFAAAVEDLVDAIPGHGVYLCLELMLHSFILVLRLFGYSRDVGGDVPSSHGAVSAARDQHAVLVIVDVDHV